MSKVEAYICDFGDHLVKEPGVVGIVPTEDLFDRELSFPTSFCPEKCPIHYCVDCYKEHVLKPASWLVDRKGGLSLSVVKEHEERIKALRKAGDDQGLKIAESALKTAKIEAQKVREREYELKIKELAYSFRDLTVKKWRSKKK